MVAALFDPGPLLGPPAGDLRVVALGGAAGGPLRAPAMAAQQPPHMPAVVADPGQPPDPANDVLDGTTCGKKPENVMGGYQDRCGYGPRQPLLVISPFAKSNFVDHSTSDQTSILRLVEDNWGLGRIGNFSFDAKAGSSSASTIGALTSSSSIRRRAKGGSACGAAGRDAGRAIIASWPAAHVVRVMLALHVAGAKRHTCDSDA
jgi:Phosphoesterase family